VFKSLAANLNRGENNLKIRKNKFRFYFLVDIEIAQHINGDSYGQKN